MLELLISACASTNKIGDTTKESKLFCFQRAVRFRLKRYLKSNATA